MEKHLKKALMWYKVKELRSEGLNKSQIAEEVGICRKTVRRYLGMNEKEFHLWLGKTRSLPKKLQAYYQFIANILEDKPYLSAAQIEDRLKEHFSDLPSVHSKTVYNFVQNIRKEKNIPKPKSEKRRDFQKIPELDYGYEAQVDFGVYNMIKQSGGRQKVWFFAMVLSRSRQKFVYFQSSPFTAASSVYAHQLAFDFFQGCPQKVLYDQDRVFMIDENLGDLLLTDELRRYVSGEDFEAVFCRKADPQSKGKVENVVGYVKKNFLKGREFVNTDCLNEAALAWLSRTGNAKKHAGILKIPQQE
jgi:transposase